MLATQRMSSHGGSLPFGYDQKSVENIGLPDFMHPGPPPPGHSILNDEENNQLHSFLGDFDSNHLHNMPSHFPPNHNDHMPYEGLPLYYGSETSIGHGPGIEPHNLHMNRQYPLYGNALPAQAFHHMNGQPTFNPPMHQFMDPGAYQNALAHQLESAAATIQQPQPGFTHNWNQEPYQPQGHPLQTPGRGPIMDFGSDPHFNQSGFHPQTGLLEPGDQSLEWLESGPNTQPNTRPNTQPSSPNWSKRRKLNDFELDRSNGVHGPNGHLSQPSPPHSNSRRQKSINSVIKPERTQSSQPLTPFTNSKSHSLGDDQDSDDAAAESDDGHPSTLPTANATRSPSPPAPWPASKARPPKSNKPPPPPKPPKRRKKSTSTTSTTPAHPKPPAKPSRTPSSRVPLSSEQKKANHTNSEQRRRDTTARAFAELYDLVPELNTNSKQSTMKKLELVVEKVRGTMKAVETLRGKLGIVAGGSVSAIARSQGLDFTTMAQLGSNGELYQGAGGSLDGDGDDGDGGSQEGGVSGGVHMNLNEGFP